MDKIDELIKNEVEFCEEMEFEKNEHNAYIYKSSNGHETMNLPCILNHYKDWLIEKGIVKEL